MNTILLDAQLLLETTSSFNSSALPPFQKFLCYLHRICIYPLESLLKTINSKLLLNMPYLAPQSLHTKLIKTFCLTQGRGIIIIFSGTEPGFLRPRRQTACNLNISNENKPLRLELLIHVDRCLLVLL